MKSARLSSAVLLLPLFALGCYSAEQLTVEAPSSYALNERRGAVTVGVKPYATTEDTRAMFGADVTHSYLPVLVVVQNDDVEVKILERAEVMLVSSDGVELRPITAQRAARRFRYAVDDDEAWSPKAAMNDNEPGGPMERDWVRKELPTTTNLRQGKRVGGVVYFSRAGKPPYTIRVDVLGMKTQKTEVIEIGLPVVAAPDE